MKCEKCGKVWPSEYYFHVAEQCIECDSKENILRNPSDIGLHWKGVRTRSGSDKYVRGISIFLAIVMVYFSFPLIKWFAEELPFFLGIRDSVTLSLPINIRYVENSLPQRDVSDTATNITWTGHNQASLTLHNKGDLQAYYLFSRLIYHLLIEFLLVLMILFTLNIEKKKTFNQQNINLLKITYWITLVAIPAYNIIRSVYVSGMIQKLQTDVLELKSRVDYEYIVIAWVLLAILLGIMQRGLKLQREQDLTI